MILAWRRSKYTAIDIKGISVEKWQNSMKQRTISNNEISCSLVTSVHYTSTSQTVTIKGEDGVANS